MNKIIKNIQWLITDKLLILIFQFFIGVKIANHYGSLAFGEYNYVVSIVAFSSIFFELLNARVIKKYYENNLQEYIVYNVNFFKNGIAILIFLCCFIIGKLVNIDERVYILLVILSFNNILAMMTFGIENYFEYILQSRKIVIANNIVRIISYFFQLIGIYMGMSIVFVPISTCIGNVIRIIILKKFYKNISKIKIKVSLDMPLIKNMFKDSFYLWGSFVAFLVYTQLDKIMLGNFLGDKEVGVYSIAVQLTGILAILISPIQSSIFPKMLEIYGKNIEEYRSFYLKSNVVITQIYILITIISIIIVHNTFLFIFSKEYIGAIVAYDILSISIFIKANGALQTGHMTIKNITKKSFYKTFFGLFLNGGLNYYLIKKYGINGAAWATSITQIFTLFIIDFFIKEYREQAMIQLKSLNPIYVIKMLKERKNV